MVSPEKMDHLCDVFANDLQALIQFAMIEAMETSAKANKCKMEWEPYDGFIKYKGSFDTYLISESIAAAVKKVAA